MKLGLLGAQRVGKTTLCKAFAEANGFEFIATTTSKILSGIGMDPRIHYPIAQRLEAQSLILKGLAKQWESGTGNCVFDRTPLDVLAYAEADIRRDFAETAELTDGYLAYRQECLDLACDFDNIVLVQPGITIVEEEGKALGNLPYMEHFNSLAFGYIAERSLNTNLGCHILPRRITDLAERVTWMTKIFGEKV